MSVALLDLMQLSREALVTGFVVFLRVGGMMALLPAFGEQSIPARVRLVLGLAFTAIVLPAVQAPAPTAPVCAAEAVLGLLLGAMLRLFVLSLQIAGTLAAQASSLAQLFGGTGGEPQPAIGHLLTLGGLALAVGLGLHVKLAALMIGSYDALPPGQFPDAGLVRAWGVGGIAKAFALAFTLAAPFVIAGLIYNVALGAINRAMPQLMVAFVGAPALTAGGLILLAIAAPTGLSLWHSAFDTFLSDPFEVAR